ncbi:hypothetical protein BTO06_17700 [Tenacibaculum sp. SZ-18]|uniref:DUF1800 domain-containing protein n=1 Tax=Tenacibaculum sp. SZ-18 TaxID=754423 RepID=UPI000C2CEC6E|nr:DUF1800 domain-containing protein [Tenacibaculum sp. SZ-18]AUC16867.1 hypothetical protein BTO06_17700 [Tenacibaculum sp. SZ-18]
MKNKHILHLYNRIGFGILPKEVEKLHSQTRSEIVDTLFQSAKTITPLYIETSFLNSTSTKKIKNKSKRKELMKLNRKKVRELNLIWMGRLMNSKEILREKMTLFWANHFVCEDKNVLYALHYNNTLRNHALGNFGDFVKAISKEAAMLKYLNNKQNKKNSPNENFARELLELFTLGQGNYSEKDIRESARAFTGYNHRFDGDFILKRKQHDNGKKEFLDRVGNFDGNDIIDIILQQKQCARFICHKIYAYFVNDKINSSRIEEMTSIFYKDYNIEKLMKHVLKSDWFYDEENIGVKIKSPIELLATIHKTVPYTFQKSKQQILIQKLLGQVLLYPPNVAGWKTGKGWIDSNTMVTRLRLASVLLNNAEISYSEKDDFKAIVNSVTNEKRRKKAFIKTETNWHIFNKNYESISNEELFESLIICPITSGTKEIINQYKDLPKKDFCIQLMSLPEYQLC